MLGKEETIVLILNAYARQSIWRECLAVISDIRKTEDPRFGTTTFAPLTPSYVSKIGLLAKLVEGNLSLSNLNRSSTHWSFFPYSFHRISVQGIESSYREVFPR